MRNIRYGWNEQTSGAENARHRKALFGLGYVLRKIIDILVSRARPGMGGATEMDMRGYMDMFMRHTGLRRVEEISGGVRTTTETDSADFVAELQAHVSSTYTHLDQGSEVTCMSSRLPTLFRRAADYERQITLTPGGVVVVETSSDPELTNAIREHAREVTGFVVEGMPAMMSGMMGGAMMGPGTGHGMMGPTR